MVLIYRDQSRKDRAAMSGLEDFGHPGYRNKHWLAITGVEGYTQNGREMLSVRNG
jgi:hypothetical protein